MSVPTAGPDYERASGRATLILADDPDARARLSAAAAVADARIAAEGGLDDATALIVAQTGTAALVLAIDRDGGAALDALLDRVAAGVRAAQIDALAIVPAALIDIACAGLADSGATVLVDPSDAEIAGALGRLVAARRAGVAEPDGDDQRRLAELSEETARIARALASLSEGRTSFAASAEAAPQAVLAAVRAMIRVRRMRDQFFDPALFADPAWDMLLDLFAAGLERRQVAVSSLCIAAAVPPTTALRWIAAMTAQGLIERRPDAADRRRMFLALSARAAAAMAGYVAAMLRHLAPTAS